MKGALARHWRWFVVAAVLLDIAIIAVAYLTGDFTNAMVIFPLRWLVMAGGVFAARWAEQAGVLSLAHFGRAATYLVFGFTAAALIGGALSGFPL
jgi:hypothetical protein